MAAASAPTKEQHLGDYIFSIQDFLAKRECQDLIVQCEDRGFTRSPPSGGGHGRTGREDPRNNSFTVWTDREFAQQLWTRARKFLPADLSFIDKLPYFNPEKGGGEWKIHGILDKFRCYKYEKGEAYPEHMDGAWRRTITTASGEHFQQQTFVTLLLYLNHDFEGGHTLYYPSDAHCRFLRHVENKRPMVEISPQCGNALVQVHHIVHEGAPVTSGVKYVIRTDVIYQRPMELHPKLAKFQREGESSSKAEEWEKLFEPSCKLYHDG